MEHVSALIRIRLQERGLSLPLDAKLAVRSLGALSTVPGPSAPAMFRDQRKRETHTPLIGREKHVAPLGTFYLAF